MEHGLSDLSGQVGITSANLDYRKGLLQFGPDDVAALHATLPAARLQVDEIVNLFYRQQLQDPVTRMIIADSDTFARLNRHMAGYVTRFFGGEYGIDYVNSRLVIGQVHARLGITPAQYVSSLLTLETVMHAKLSVQRSEALDAAMRKLLMLDLQLTFDAYIHFTARFAGRAAPDSPRTRLRSSLYADFDTAGPPAPRAVVVEPRAFVSSTVKELSRHARQVAVVQILGPGARREIFAGDEDTPTLVALRDAIGTHDGAAIISVKVSSDTFCLLSASTDENAFRLSCELIKADFDIRAAPLELSMNFAECDAVDAVFDLFGTRRAAGAG